MLTKYGINNIMFFYVAGIVLIVLAIITENIFFSIILGLPGLILIIFTFIFFRDPDRKIPQEALNSESVIVSPADGKVMEVIEINEDTYLHSKAIQISIFLSPLDVHVNRAPTSGTVRYFRFFPGKYLAAYVPESSVKNVQTHIGVENQYGKILFKQIVGVLARRLVWDIKEGDTLQVGQRFGMMKFGSRMDVILPVDSEIRAKSGDRVVAGETIIARVVREDGG